MARLRGEDSDMAESAFKGLPRFTLLAPKPVPNRRTGQCPPGLCDSWRSALADLPPDLAERFVVLEGKLDDVEVSRAQFDCLVSPANSFGIMDGGYDMALSKAVRADGDIWSLTNVVQDHLRDHFRGFLPPSSVAIVPLPAGFGDNPFGAHCVAVVPTMRCPEDVSWHKDLVFDCFWNLLVALDRWNNGAGSGQDGRRRIGSVLMTGLATGQGGVSPDRCARQMVAALTHFVRGWGQHPRWDDVGPALRAIDATRDL